MSSKLVSDSAWDLEPNVFLSRWVARVSPAPSGSRRASGSSTPVESFDDCPGGAVELVDDCGFEWGHGPGTMSNSSTTNGTYVLDLLALLRTPQFNVGRSRGSFFPELELMA